MDIITGRLAQRKVAVHRENKRVKVIFVTFNDSLSVQK
jgi:hypothetical protein